MKKVLFLLAVCLGFSFSSFAQRGEEWKMVWHDEFDGSGAFDPEKWQSEEGFVRNEEPQWYQAENTYRDNGLLVLEARWDSIPNPNYREGDPSWRNNRPYARYSSGSVNTRGKYDFLYGQLEVRARISGARGSWPAIWTLGSQMPWPSNGEVDVMEYYHYQGVPTVLANAAWGSARPNSAIWDSSYTPLTHFTEQDPDWCSRFHIWLMDWTPEYIRLYLDGELLNEIDLSQTINGSIGEHKNPFHSPQYILLDNAVDIRYTPNRDAFPIRYEVDYVRVWQK